MANKESAYSSNGSATAGVIQGDINGLGTRSPDAGDYAGSWTGAVPAGRSNDISHLRSEVFIRERLKTVEYKKMTEEEQAFWDWWREIGGKQMEITPLDIWLAGVKWERERLKNFHDTPEV